MFFQKLQKKLGSITNTSLTNEIYRNILRNSKIVKKHFSIKELKDKIVKFFKDPNQKMDLSTGFVQNIFRTTQDCDEFDYQSSAYPVR